MDASADHGRREIKSENEKEKERTGRENGAQHFQPDDDPAALPGRSD